MLSIDFADGKVDDVPGELPRLPRRATCLLTDELSVDAEVWTTVDAKWNRCEPGRQPTARSSRWALSRQATSLSSRRLWLASLQRPGTSACCRRDDYRARKSDVSPRSTPNASSR